MPEVQYKQLSNKELSPRRSQQGAEANPTDQATQQQPGDPNASEKNGKNGDKASQEQLVQESKQVPPPSAELTPQVGGEGGATAAEPTTPTVTEEGLRLLQQGDQGATASTAPSNLILQRGASGDILIPTSNPKEAYVPQRGRRLPLEEFERLPQNVRESGDFFALQYPEVSPNSRSHQQGVRQRTAGDIAAEESALEQIRHASSSDSARSSIVEASIRFGRRIERGLHTVFVSDTVRLTIKVRIAIAVMVLLSYGMGFFTGFHLYKK